MTVTINAVGPSSAIVIGGGIGGLSAALQLRRLGLEVVVFERQPRLSEVHTGLSLWAFAVRRLHELGMAEALAQIGKPIECLVHRTATGRHLSDVPVPALEAFPGIASYEVHRSKLQAHQALPTLGISAGLAIEDAAVLAESLSTAADAISGLRLYERRRRPVSARVVRTAALFGRVQMIHRQPAYALRQLGVRIAPQRRGIEWVVRGGNRPSRRDGPPS